MRSINGRSLAATIAPAKAWAVLQAMTSNSAPARSRPRAMAASAGPARAPSGDGGVAVEDAAVAVDDQADMVLFAAAGVRSPGSGP